MKGENVIEFRRLLASLDEDFRTMRGKRSKMQKRIRHI